MMTPDSHTSSTNPHFALMRLSCNAALLRQSLGSEMKHHGPGNGLCQLLYAAQQLEQEIKCYLKYDPNQPRVPAGSPEGGQWTAVGTSGGGSAATGAETGTGRSFKPVYDGEPDEPIEAVYPIEEGVGLLVGGPSLGALRQGVRRGTVDLSWTLGKHKSSTKWANQMRARGWTPEKISDTIKNGKRYKAPNDVRKRMDPRATATRYEKDGKFVVRDDQTGEIIQISAPGNFIPNQLP